MKLIIKMLILLMCLFCVGCGARNTEGVVVRLNTDKYESYVTNTSNDGIVTSIEKNWWSGGKNQDILAKRSMSISIDNVKVDGEYQESYYATLDWQKQREYESESGVVFHINDETNEMIGFHKGASRAWLNEEFSIKTEHLSETEIEKIADSYVSKYIDISEYKKEKSDDYPVYYNSREIPLYTYEYTKYRGEFRTYDHVYLQITANGTIRTFHIYNLSAFDTVTTDKIDKEKLAASIDEKIKNLYGEKCVSYRYEIMKQTLTFSPDKDLVVASQIEVYITDKGGNEYGSGLVLSTIVGEAS